MVLGKFELLLQVLPLSGSYNHFVPVYVGFHKVDNHDCGRNHWGVEIIVFNVSFEVWYIGERNYYEHDDNS